MKRARIVIARWMLTITTAISLAALLAAPAAAAEPTVTGTVAVGGTVTVSGDLNQGCSGQSANAQLRRPLGENTSVGVVSGSVPLVLGQPWSISLTIPATDLLGTPLAAGDQVVVSAGGICNGDGDQFAFVYDDVFLTLGEPVAAATTTTTTPTTTTTTTQTTTTTTPAGSTTTTPASAAAAATTTAAPAAAPAALPRTGPGNSAAAAVVAAAAIVLGAMLILTRRATPGWRDAHFRSR